MLAAVLVPVGSGDAGTRLAVRWSGDRPARLELVALQHDRVQSIGEWVVGPGLDLISAHVDSDPGQLRVRVRDDADRIVADAQVQAVPALVESAQATIDEVEMPTGSEVVIETATLPAIAGPVDWKPTFGHNSGPSGVVFAVQKYDDGSGPSIVIGGRFRIAGGMRVNGVARWNGVSWSPLGTGISGGADPFVRTMLVHGGDLIVAGSFSSAGGNPANNIARWDGSAWSAFGAGMNERVWALAIHESQLVAGGSFTTAGTGPALRIARWSGTEWQPIGAGFSGTVRAITVHAGQLVAGGEFAASGATPVGRVARWTGTSWQALGSGLSGTVNALSSHAGLLYAGGSALSQAPIYPLMRWDGLAWERVGTALTGEVSAMAVRQNALVVADEQAIRRWNGSAWTAIAAYIDGPVYALVPDGDALYAAGNLGALEGVVQTAFIARHEDGGWQAFGTNPGPQAAPHAVVDGVLIGRVSRYFSDSQLLPVVSEIHRWTGGAWVPVPGVFQGSVLAVSQFQGQLIAAGSFSSVDGQSIGNIARWDGSQWQALGAGLNGSVRRLALHDGHLIALGSFDADGTGNAMARIARWNGAQWQAMGSLSDLIPSPEALTRFDGELVVAGYDFSGVPAGGAGRVARWTGTAWMPIGGELPHRIHAVEVHAGALYATGGTFTNQSYPAAYRWTGTSWVPEGPGLSGPNVALASHDGVLYAGGRGGLARRIGTAWDHPFDAREIARLLPFGADLVVAGNLTALDAVPSLGTVAIGPSQATATSITSVTPVPAPEGSAITIRVEVAATPAPIRGHVTVVGAPGGSCSDLSLEVVDASRSQAECTIRWTTPGLRTLRAHYLGASDGTTTWQGSVSSGFALEVIAERLLVDGFESPP